MIKLDPAAFELVDASPAACGPKGQRGQHHEGFDAATQQLQFGAIRKQAQGVEGEGSLARLKLKGPARRCAGGQLGAGIAAGRRPQGAAGQAAAALKVDATL